MCVNLKTDFLQVAEPNLQRTVEDADVLIFALPFQVSYCGEYFVLIIFHCVIVFV